MPLYQGRCRCGKTAEYVATVANRHVDAPVCHGQMRLEIMPAMVNADIAPYMAVAGDMAGKPIGSRREHREYLKRNALVEVGSEPVKPIKNDFRPKKGEIAEELKRVIPQVLRR
jgi:hypothetical protein